jgi:hypothetical protein
LEQTICDDFSFDAPTDALAEQRRINKSPTSLGPPQPSSFSPQNAA